MIRRCTGTDPNLIRHEPPWDPAGKPRQELANERPCDCGKVFDDVHYSVVYPHPPIGGGIW